MTIDDMKRVACRAGWSKAFPTECGFEFCAYDLGDLRVSWHEHADEGDDVPLIIRVTYPHAAVGTAVTCWQTDEWDHGDVATARDFLEFFDVEVPA